MRESISPKHLQRYFRLLREGCRAFADFSWLEEAFERHPTLARRRLPSGELPLRVLLDRDAPPGLFCLLAEHGAEHDVITASAATDVETVEQLLSVDPDIVHETDSEGNTPLHWACVKKYAKQPGDTAGLVDLLVAAGPCFEVENHLGETPLDRSLLVGNGDAALALLDHGAVPNVRYGVIAEDFELLDDILADEPGQIRWLSRRDGQSLLHLAIQWECHSSMFDYLVARGSYEHLEAPFSRAARTPLLLAITSHNFDAAEALIRLGADVNARENRKHSEIPNKSALQMAVQNDRVGLAEMLISHGADVRESRAREGGSLLCGAKSSEMAELLISSRVDLQTRDHFGRSPLENAVEEGRRDVVATLIRHGTKPTFFAHVVLGEREQLIGMLDHDSGLISAHNLATAVPLEPDREEEGIEIPFGSTGGTALHYAAKAGLLDIVKLLIDRGANVNAATPQKWTPLHDATYYTIRHDLRDGATIIRSLVAAGADVDAETIGGHRPIEIAEYLSFDERSCDIFDLLAELGRERDSNSNTLGNSVGWAKRSNS